MYIYQLKCSECNLDPSPSQEYEEQGRVETERALKDLREHCRNSGMWETISNLKSPKRSVPIVAVCLSVLSSVSPKGGYQGAPPFPNLVSFDVIIGMFNLL